MKIYLGFKLLSGSFALFLILSVLPQKIDALESFCDIGSVSVNPANGTIVVIGSVREGSPGLDNSTVYMNMYDTGSEQSITRTVNQDSLTDSYTGYNVPPGQHIVYLDGQTTSNPGAFISDCSDSYIYTMPSPQMWELQVDRNVGSGSGYVYSSNVGGIDCGGDCYENYNEGTWVTLEADPASGSTFTGWGGECSGTGSCTFQMNGNRQVTANFSANQTAPGAFNVTSGACYDWPNPKIETNFNPSSGADYYVLQKWFGSYYGDIYTGSYQQVDSYGDPNVSSGNTYYYRVVAWNNSGQSTISNGEWTQYVDQPTCGGPSTYLLSTGINSGVGTIIGTGISCPGDCAENIPYDTWTTITAYAATGHAFSSWSGACAGQGASCSLFMNQARSASANFSTNAYTLTVAKNGTGGGTITSSPAGISCGSQCSNNFNYNTSITLTAVADAGAVFAGWSGACTGT